MMHAEGKKTSAATLFSQISEKKEMKNSETQTEVPNKSLVEVTDSG